jgi:acyl-CoA synthetase (AMP-forming)/AMP-acid ligase II/thioesterase domain-containing protein/acyl carrier protein
VRTLEFSLEKKAHSVGGTGAGQSTIGAEIRRFAERQPDHVAVVASDFAPLSYQELQCLIDEVRVALRVAGFGRSARIAIAMRNGPQAALAIVAVACSAVSIPLNPRQTLGEIETCLAALRPNAVLVVKGADSAARRVAEHKSITIIEATQSKDGSLGFSVALPKTSIAATPDESDEPDTDVHALILQTSGTSNAEPKLIPVTHRIMLAAAEREQVCYELTPLDRCLSVTPIWYAFGLLLPVFTPLLTGGSVAFPANALEVDLSEWLTALMPTWYSAAPTLHLSILERLEAHAGAKRKHSLRFVLTGGASPPQKVREGLQSILGVPMLDRYGASETQLISTNRPPPGPSRPGTCGVPWPNTVSIFGDDGRQVGASEQGEIFVSGPTVISGYLNAPELNRTRFVNGWFKTGDIGCFDEDGFLTLHGRRDDLINRGGEKISPVEIDDALTRHPAVAEAAAFAVPHPRLGEDVAAAVVLHPGMTATPIELRAYLQERLASFKVPRRIVIRDQLPKGDIGKVIRRQLTERLDKRAAVGMQTRMPQSIQDMSVDSNLVVQLREIWERLLKISPLSLDDDFFENGGDSLLAMEMLVELERLIGRKIPTSILFDAPTIGQLAQKLSDSDYLNQKPKVLTRLNSSGNQTPLLYFHGDFEEGGYYAVKLASLLGPDQPLFIVAPHGLGDEPIPSSIEAMAADRLLLIRDAQPKGPYRLCGYCNGGVVAFEVARRLISAGEQVEMVGMIDPPPVNAPSSRLQRLSKRLQRFSHLPLAQQWAAVRRKVENLAAGGVERTPFERSAAKLLNYFPKPLDVRVLYFSVGYDAETWRRISPDLDVIKLPGDHLSVLIDPTDLAVHLKARLQANK